ncbi:unnamed protein product [Lampetra planeri]
MRETRHVEQDGVAERAAARSPSQPVLLVPRGDMVHSESVMLGCGGGGAREARTGAAALTPPRLEKAKEKPSSAVLERRRSGLQSLLSPELSISDGQEWNNDSLT